MTLRPDDKLDLETFTQALARFEDVFAIYDENYKLVFANSAAFDAMPEYFWALKKGHPVAEATRRQLVCYHPELPHETIKKLTKMMLERLTTGVVYEVGVTKNRTLQVTHEKLNSRFTLALGIDITKIKTQEGKMKSLANENFKLANTDQLTGLANRRQFIKTLDEKIKQHELEFGSFFVGLIDLNGFKRINDLYGHAVGDELLIGVAERATRFIDETTFLARLGGDEFALITHTNQSQLDLLSFSAGLCEILRKPQCLSGNDISVSASLGWASFPKDGRTASDLLLKSDYALYKSKYSESRKTVIFSGKDETLMQRESELTGQLDSSDLESELHLEFQPVHKANESALTGFEALARWENAALGMISPTEFIPLAEKIGHISKLTKIILKKALSTAIHWPKSIDLHVNISAIDLGRMDVMSELIEIVLNSGYAPGSVVFEVTETAIARTFESFPEVFDLISRSGVRLGLDDFGIEFSSLNYLGRVPVACLKIDQSFIGRLKPGSDEEKILKTIKFLSENMELDCVVKGVETQSQFNQLSSLDLTHMQGFLFSQSLKPEELGAYILQSSIGSQHQNIYELSFFQDRVA